MRRGSWVPGALVGVLVGVMSLAGCSSPKGDSAPKPGPKNATAGEKEKAEAKAQIKAGEGKAEGAATDAPPAASARTATAAAADVEAATKVLDGLGVNSKYTALPNGLLTEIVIQDGSVLSGEHMVLFGKLTDLEKLQIYNFRDLNDELTSHLAGLKQLKTLALTNSVINASSVEMIAKSFPDLKDLDLSSNTNLTNSVLKVICGMSKLQRLTLVQNRFDDLGTGRLSRLDDLRILDLRGNMGAGDMTMDTIADLPKLSGLKHRSSAVSDAGIESLARSQSLESLLMQDFAVTNQSGQHLAKLGKLTQLEIFRCQGFGTDGVLALKDMKLTRLMLRDLPMVNDQAMAVFADLPALQRLYLHEIASVSDSGLQNLAALKSLEVLDIWAVSQMTDASVEIIAVLPKLKELSIRATGVSDAAVDKILGMPHLQSLTFKQNGKVTDEGLKKLTSKKWLKLDIGSTEADATEPH